MMIKTVKWERVAACFAITVLIAAGLLGSIYNGRSADAADVEISETEVISTEKGNGPQKITSIEDMGWTQGGMTNFSNSSKCPGTITNNKVKFFNFASSAYYSVGMTNNGWKEWDWGWTGSGSSLAKTIPVSMKHSWKLSGKVLIAKCYTDKEASLFAVRIEDTDSPVLVQGEVYEYSGKIYFGTASMLGSEQELELFYDAVNNQITCTIGGVQLFCQDNPIQDKATIQFGGTRWRNGQNLIPTNNLDGYMIFNSFEYTDHYIKADNTITDYAGRKITGAVGNGHTIGIHPKVYNNIPANTQRYSGTVALDSMSEVKNLVLKDTTDGKNISSGPLAFTLTSDPYKDITFEAEVDTAGVPYTAGQKFRLPLVINDDYFGASGNFAGNTGAAADWDKLKHDSGEGKKDQLPLRLNLLRDTHRTLANDLKQGNTPTSAAADYTHTTAGKTVKPNAHGWYNNNVTISFQSDPGEFNELNFSTAVGNEKITTGSIKYTAASGGSFTVRGLDGEGAPTDDGETPEDGNTYSVFGRKGTSKETEDLSAVTTETFRIDKTAPTLKIEDRDKLSDPRKLKAEDALSGVDYIKWKGPKETEFAADHIITIEKDPKAILGAKKPTAQSLPRLTELGSYTFIAVDLAGNESEPLIITNNRPVISAGDVKVSFKDTIKNFNLLTAHKAGAKDKEDGDLDADRLDWEVRKKDADTILDKGTGKAGLSDFLPVGTYEVTFFLNDTGTDADGNKPDPEKVKVKLTITPEGPPDIILNEDPGAGTVDGTTTTRPDGSRHYAVEDEKTLIVDTEKPYSGGSLTDQEIKEEIEDHFNFKSKLPYPVNGLEIDLKIYDDKGNDITGTPVNTTKNGSYTAVYVATDKSGCTTTLQLTYNIKENIVVTFHPGKGDYKDGSENRQVEIKVNKAPSKADLPDGADTGVLLPPADTCFIGWGTSQSSKTTVDPTAIKLNKDTSYYAVYGPDINNNNIPDSKEALFTFQSGEPEHAAFKYADKTMVGLLVPVGSMATLPSGRIPELLFERTKDTGYRLAGWKTDATEDIMLTTEELCALGREAGTKLKVTAQIESYPIEAADKVKVTFFSSDPENAPLKGGEGQTLYLEAPKEGEPVYLKESQLPAVKLGNGCAMEGWKLEKTGDQLMEDKKVTEEKLYQGETVACIAYVKKPAKDTGAVVTEEKPVSKTITKTKIQKQIEIKTEKQAKEGRVIFAFYSSNQKNGEIKDGDGTMVSKTANADGYARLGSGQTPQIVQKKGSKFAGWQTSVTGKQLIGSDKLETLKVPAGVNITCTAVFEYNEVKVADDETGSKTLNTVGLADEKVPLGSAPFAGNGKKDGFNCRVHYFMLLWLALSAVTVITRLHRRKEIIYSLPAAEAAASLEKEAKEKYMEIAEEQKTCAGDYIFMACIAVCGAILFMTGACSLELPLFIVGIAGVVYFFIRMKLMDHNLKKWEDEINQ